MVTPEQRETVRAAARERRQSPAAAAEARRGLAGVIDTGMLSDADCIMLFAVYNSELEPTNVILDASVQDLPL